MDDISVQKFDENQSRDSHGRWTVGGLISVNDPEVWKVPKKAFMSPMRVDEAETFGDFTGMLKRNFIPVAETMRDIGDGYSVGVAKEDVSKIKWSERLNAPVRDARPDMAVLVKENEIVGVFAGDTIAIEPEHRGKGLSNELYRERLRLGALATGSGGGSFSKAGHAARASFHESEVAAAVADGKPVPKVVLKDYPELAAKAHVAGVVNSKEFKAWFGDSKAVDESGKPLVVYHGTGKEGFTEFDPEKSGGNMHSQTTGVPMFFFASNVDVADTYAQQGDHEQIIPTYLSLQNPLIIDANGRDWTETIGDVSDNIRTYRTEIEKELAEYQFELGNKYKYEYEFEPEFDYPPEEREKLSRLHRAFEKDILENRKKYDVKPIGVVGYDGVIIRNSLDMTAHQPRVDEEVGHYNPYSDIYIAFKPEQVKSATGNKGSFDPKSKDIRKSNPNHGPDGKFASRSGSSSAKVTETTEFKKWFGKSKVVDKAGNPLQLFHGTVSEFDSFDPSKSNSNTGTGVPEGTFFFSDSPDAASSYAGQKTHHMILTTPAHEKHYEQLIREGRINEAVDFFTEHGVRGGKTYKQGANVIPVFLKIEKPLRVNAKGDNWRSIYYKDEEWSTNDLAAFAKSKGYDGLIIKNIHDRQEGKGEPSTVYAVFDPTQVKSSTGNDGSYGLENKNIRKSNPNHDNKGRFSSGNSSAYVKPTETANFKKWFAGSKVVDYDGNPREVYHGTAREFESFDADRIGQSNDFGYAGAGFYFMSSPEWASAYAEVGNEGKPGKRVIPVYLAIKNPKIVDTYEELGIQGVPSRDKAHEVRDRLIENGHDGVIVRGVPGSPTEYVAFHSGQIKSSVGNDGSFNGKDHDIRKFNPNEPRDANGRWTSGGSSSSTPSAIKAYADMSLPEDVRNAAKDYAENGTRSAAFKSWFGDWENDPDGASKVVDDDGTPKESYEIKKVYHGTRQDFDAFDKTLIGDNGIVAGKGFYFAEDKRIANTYANPLGVNGRQKGSVAECYLSIKNPFDFDRLYSESSLSEFIKVVKSKSHLRDEYAEGIISPEDAGDDFERSLKQSNYWSDNGQFKLISGYGIWKSLSAAIGVENVNDILTRMGHDGVTHESKDVYGTPKGKRDKGEYGRVWIAFEPTQIKAVDNLGTFDPENSNIKKFDENQSRDDHGRWASGGEHAGSRKNLKVAYPKHIPGKDVSGLSVLKDIPNMSSISSSLDDYEVMPGVREVPMSLFAPHDGRPGYANVDDHKRVHALVAAIKSSKKIKPLIVVVDKDGPYILEGGHRYDALRIIGVDKIAAKVVIDRSSLPAKALKSEHIEKRMRTLNKIDIQKANPNHDSKGRFASGSFSKWFSGSKVVDDDGKPLTVYHGTSSESFDVFNTSRDTESGNTSDPNAFIGSHFSVSETPANRFAQGLYDADENNGRVYPVHLSIKKPLQVGDGRPDKNVMRVLEKEYSDAGKELETHSVKRLAETNDSFRAAIESGDEDAIARALHDPIGDALYKKQRAVAEKIRVMKDENRPIRETEIYAAAGMDYDEISSKLAGMKGKKRVAYAAFIGKKLKRRLEAAGYDGVYYENFYEEETGIGAGDRGRATYIAFHPEQIKSAIGNDGSYDPKNADIRKMNPNHDEKGRFASAAGSASIDVHSIPTISEMEKYLTDNAKEFHFREGQVEREVHRYSRMKNAEKIKFCDASDYPIQKKPRQLPDLSDLGDMATAQRRLTPNEEDISLLRRAYLRDEEPIKPEETIFVRHETSKAWQKDMLEFGIDTRVAPPDTNLGRLTLDENKNWRQSSIEEPGLFIAPAGDGLRGGIILQVKAGDVNPSTESLGLGYKNGLAGLYGAKDAILSGKVYGPEHILGVVDYDHAAQKWIYVPNPKNPNSGKFEYDESRYGLVLKKDVAITKMNENHDAKGRFASGGSGGHKSDVASGSSQLAYPPPKAPTTHSYADSRQGYDRMFETMGEQTGDAIKYDQDEEGKPYFPYVGTVNVKVAVISDVASKMRKADIDGRIKESIDTLIASGLIEEHGHEMEDSYQQITSEFVAAWAKGSSGDSKNSQVLQECIRRMMGMETASDAGVTPVMAMHIDKVLHEHGDAVKAVAEAMYQNTQDWFRDHKITEVTVFRGMKFPKDSVPEFIDQIKHMTPEEKMVAGEKFQAWTADNVHVQLNPLSSFAFYSYQADSFALDVRPVDAMLMTMRIPVEHVFSTALSGIGCASETELVVMHHESHRASVYVAPARYFGRKGNEKSLLEGDENRYHSPPKKTRK